MLRSSFDEHHLSTQRLSKSAMNQKILTSPRFSPLGSQQNSSSDETKSPVRAASGVSYSMLSIAKVVLFVSFRMTDGPWRQLLARWLDQGSISWELCFMLTPVRSRTPHFPLVPGKVHQSCFNWGILHPCRPKPMPWAVSEEVAIIV